MEEKPITSNETGNNVVDSTPDYLAAINELKSNSVDRQKYESLLAENKKLINQVVNGQTLVEEVESPKIDIKGLRSELFGKNHNENLTNLEYVTKVLKLREGIIAEGKPDPFCGFGHDYVPTQEEIQCAQRVAEGLQHCVDVADGNPDVFVNEFSRMVR